jgi:hypothetical protein
MSRFFCMGLAMALTMGVIGCGDDGGPSALDDAGGLPDVVDPQDDGGACSADLGAECGEVEACCISEHCSQSGICVEPFGECAALTQSCEDDADCCSGNCGGSGECVAAVCKIEALSCGASYECCSGLCANGTCVPPIGVCQEFGNGCSSNAQCCSGNCSSTCQHGYVPETCQPLGDDCDGTGGCCSGKCGIITNTCVLKGGVCKPAGEGCSEDFECCDGSCGEDHTCTAAIS